MQLTWIRLAEYPDGIPGGEMRQITPATRAAGKTTQESRAARPAVSAAWASATESWRWRRR